VSFHDRLFSGFGALISEKLPDLLFVACMQEKLHRTQKVFMKKMISMFPETQIDVRIIFYNYDS
jgi:hypothetical protein